MSDKNIEKIKIIQATGQCPESSNDSNTQVFLESLEAKAPVEKRTTTVLYDRKAPSTNKKKDK